MSHVDVGVVPRKPVEPKGGQVLRCVPFADSSSGQEKGLRQTAAQVGIKIECRLLVLTLVIDALPTRPLRRKISEPSIPPWRPNK
ncbi:hypothetical protein O9K51_06336 [Purpureocillium lavendulum]|uniref:Uncharacterized protein n=1 Tax=Purpureocillium lavendulum TaxID=1247861 RepID=A0AB34FQ94_9HYPO|nr:hypothetical protein O9K51_06336 [Purpureocillium lavendulum]